MCACELQRRTKSFVDLDRRTLLLLLSGFVLLPLLLLLVVAVPEALVDPPQSLGRPERGLGPQLGLDPCGVLEGGGRGEKRLANVSRAVTQNSAQKPRNCAKYGETVCVALDSFHCGLEEERATKLLLTPRKKAARFFSSGGASVGSS